MKLRAGVIAALAIATAATSVSAQSLDLRGVTAPQVSETRAPLNLKDPAWAGLAGRNVLARPADAAPAPQTRQRQSVWPTVIGAAVGGFAGFYSGMAVALSDEPCQPNCGPRLRTAVGLFIAGPIVGGFIGRAIGKAF